MSGARRPALDWQAAHARLERARRALDADAPRPPEEVQRILRERALALASPPVEAAELAPALSLLVFSLAGERYGIETAHVVEAMPLRAVTPIPGVPALIRGVVNHRGRLLAVLDIRPLLNLPTGRGLGERSWVVAVEAAGMRVGIAAEAIEGIVAIAARQMTPRAASPDGAASVLRGVLGGMIGVLDLEALGRDPRILVNHGGD